MQEFPSYIISAASLAFFIYSAYPKYQRVEQSLESSSLLLHTEVPTYGTIQPTTTNEDLQNIPFTPKNASFVTVTRSNLERFRLSVELIAAAFLFISSLIALITPEISSEWSDVESNGLYALTLLWSYALALVLIRIFFLNAKISPKLGLWRNSTSLYLISWLLYIPNFRSSIVHPYSGKSQLFYISQFIAITILFCNSFSAKFADKSVKLFVTPGLEPSPEPISSLFAQMSYSWFDPIIWKGYFKDLKSFDIWELREDDHSYHVLYNYRKIVTAGGVLWKMMIYFRRYLAVSFIWAVLDSVIIFAPPFLMKSILEFVEDTSRYPLNIAWLCVVGMLVTGVLANITSGQSLFIGRRICIRIRAILIGEIYSKALNRKISLASEKKSDDKDNDANDKSVKDQANQGTIINLMSVDAFKISETAGYLHFFVSGVFSIIFSIMFLYRILGWSAFAGAFLMALLLPINVSISKCIKGIHIFVMKATDNRVRKLNELLESIRIIKYFAWETRFSDDIKDLRAKELKLRYKQFFMWSISSGVWNLSPVIITLITFSCYTLVQGERLSAPIAFTSLALFNILRSPMEQLSGMINSALQAKVAADRIEAFLGEPNTSKYNQLEMPLEAGAPTIGFKNASYAWNLSNESDFRLRDIDIDFKVNTLNLIVGPTGSGKSSLLSALLGEMELLQGRGYLPNARNREDVRPDIVSGYAETTAYCAQNAWLLNDTLKNNILFGTEYDEARYQAVIETCALTRDLEILDAGDETEIGEKGITLSGGQKQRVSLARAVYSNSKFLLLDDCLSAVDSHTAMKIYTDCLSGPLCALRTVILVSHNVALTVSHAGYVVVMNNGRIAGQGTPAEVAAKGLLGDDESIIASASASGSATRVQSFADLQSSNVMKSNDVTRALESTGENDGQERKKTDGKLIKEETSSEGSVKLKVYKEYFKAVGSIWFWIVLIVTYISVQVMNILQSYWIRIWTVEMEDQIVKNIHTMTKPDRFVSPFGFDTLSIPAFVQDITPTSTPQHHSTTYYLMVYALIGVLYSLISTYRTYTAFRGGLHASALIFEKTLDSIVSAKIRFFDSTPMGRIMNRLSKDVESIDQDLAANANGTLNSILSAAAVTVLITLVTPKFFFAGILILGLYGAINTFYLTTSRELKRMDSIKKSPIFQQFGETLSGVSTIRAYGVTYRFTEQNLRNLDESNRPFFYLWLANRWLSFRIDMAGSLVSFSAAALVLLSLGSIDAGLAGLSLSYAITFSESMIWVVRLYAIVEMNMNSVERLQEYMEIEKEAPAVIPDSRPPPNWPSKGEIEVENLSLRYSPELPQVIENVTFKVDSFNKIGIVGRTGAGKSTIISAFFRFIEADSGKIVIDGVDISQIGLHDLRSALAIIPQDPTLFVGTIRTNLDPFGEYTDEEIFESLRRVHLIKPSDTEMEGENKNQFRDLSNTVTEGGHNLSQGQRQLLCLARSLLKTPKVLLLDEATASIDYASDALIQATIRNEFGNNTTILTIAHRLKSIVDYDKILVLDHGKVVQYAHPHELLKTKEGTFYSMCEQSGELSLLESIAENAWNEKISALR